MTSDRSRPIPGASERLAAAVELAADAGRRTLVLFEQAALGVRLKPDGSEVTDADLDAERFIRARLAELFPGDGILGEELDEQPSDTGWRWILDPIDGTFSFVRGVPLYATLVAVERLDDTGPDAVHVGVVELPALDERVYGVRGGGAWRRMRDAEPRPAAVSETDRLEDAVVCTTSLDYFKGDAQRAAFDRVSAAAARTRGWSDAYAFALLATARVDAVFEAGLKPWDIAPLCPILHEAGGRLSDWRGGDPMATGTLAATNGRFHERFLDALEG